MSTRSVTNEYLQWKLGLIIALVICNKANCFVKKDLRTCGPKKTSTTGS